MATKNKMDTLSLKPSECFDAIKSMIRTKRALFIWGPPGISKSAITRQVADAENMGFIDVRLSQMDPTDLRGIPYPVVENGVHGVRWSAPIVLPRDLDFNVVSELYADENEIVFENPLNATYELHVHSINKAYTAVIGKKQNDRFAVSLVDGSGNSVEGKIRWTVKGKVRAILALEEFNSAPPSVQAAAYQLVLDRCLGEYKVPDGVFIVAMGNRDTDKGVTFKMPTPIMNRFVHIEMRHDFTDWQNWALHTTQHPEVVGYLTAFNDQLFSFDPSSASRGFQTPRSWEFVSDILLANPDMPYNVLCGLVFGAVGEGAGVKFVEFRKIAKDLPDSNLILSGKLKKLAKKVEVSLAYALSTTLCYKLKETSDELKRRNIPKSNKDWDEWYQSADYFLEFIMGNFQPEICIMAAKTAIQIHQLPFDVVKMKNFTVFAETYKEFIMN